MRAYLVNNTSEKLYFAQFHGYVNMYNEADISPCFDYV